MTTTLAAGERSVGDRLLGRAFFAAFFDHALDRIAHMFRTFGLENFAGDEACAEQDNAGAEHPPRNRVEPTVHAAKFLQYREIDGASFMRAPRPLQAGHLAPAASLAPADSA